MPAPIAARLGETSCPTCGGTVELRTDKKSRAYLYCQNMRAGPAGTFFKCGFHAQWGPTDSAEIARSFTGAKAPHDAESAPDSAPKSAPKAPLTTSSNDEPDRPSQAANDDAAPERPRTGTDGTSFLGC